MRSDRGMTVRLKQMGFSVALSVLGGVVAGLTVRVLSPGVGSGDATPVCCSVFWLLSRASSC